MGNWVAAIQRVGGVRFPKGLRSTRGLIGSKLSHSLSIGFSGQRQSTAPVRFREEGSRNQTTEIGTVYGGWHRSYKQ